jgi:NADH-quinone oxidoreductase subunit J
MTLLLFSYFAGAIVLTALLVVGLRNPVYSALSLLVMFFHVAGIYVLLDAEFIAAIQIIVYAGAILVLYLFVVMLLNLKVEEGYQKQLVLGLLLGLAVVAETIYVLNRSLFGKGVSAEEFPSAPAAGNTEAIGQSLYTTYLFPFEVASVILLVAMIGAIILAKKGIFEEVETRK